MKKKFKQAKRGSSFIRSSEYLLACPLNLTRVSRMTSEKIRTLFDSFILNIHFQMGENIHYFLNHVILCCPFNQFYSIKLFVIRKPLRKGNVWSIKSRTTHNLSLWLYEYSHIWPPPVAIFLALRVLESTGAIQDDKYFEMVMIRKEWH